MYRSEYERLETYPVEYAELITGKDKSKEALDRYTATDPDSFTRYVLTEEEIHKLVNGEYVAIFHNDPNSLFTLEVEK